jgi:hypothetical protein
MGETFSRSMAASASVCSVITRTNQPFAVQ